MGKTREELKKYFERGDTPTQSNFADLIDSTVNKADDGIATNPTTGYVTVARAMQAQKGATLQIRREKDDPDGSQVFLELCQYDDVKRENPTVYPCIRFLHENNWYNRLEARQDGLHVKEGNTDPAYENIYADLSVGNLIAHGNVTLGKNMIQLGTTDGSQAVNGEVVGGIGFMGIGVQHGQMSFRAGKGFELVDRSQDGFPSLGYDEGKYPYADLKLGTIIPRRIRLNNPTDASKYFQIYFEDNNDTVVFYHESGAGMYMRQDGIWQHNSDASLKENIVPLDGVLDKVMQLRPVSFDWKMCPTKGIGFVAQDVEPVFPDLVSTRMVEDGKTLRGLPYDSFAVLAIAAIKELKTQYDAKIEALEERIRALSTPG